MTALSAFGLFAVTAMLVCYALENRSPWFILAFAVACGMLGLALFVAAQERPEKEMGTEEVGRVVMDELKRLDKVAYVRFASVYRSFRDVGEFMNELKDLLNAKE